jgi:hypothetical protein
VAHVVLDRLFATDSDQVRRDFPNFTLPSSAPIDGVPLKHPVFLPLPSRVLSSKTECVSCAHTQFVIAPAESQQYHPTPLITVKPPPSPAPATGKRKRPSKEHQTVVDPTAITLSQVEKAADQNVILDVSKLTDQQRRRLMRRIVGVRQGLRVATQGDLLQRGLREEQQIRYKQQDNAQRALRRQERKALKRAEDAAEAKDPEYTPSETSSDESSVDDDEDEDKMEDIESPDQLASSRTPSPAPKQQRTRQ